MRKYAAKRAQDNRRDAAQQERPADCATATGHVFRAVVLPHKSHASLRERIEPVINDELVIEGRCRSRHRRRTQAIDCRLQADIAKREHNATKPGRQTHTHNAAQEKRRHAQLPKFEFERPYFMEQEIEQSNSANNVCKDGRNRNARHAKAKTCHENQVQNDIHCTRHHQHVKRTLCIAFAAQNRCDKVEQHYKRHSRKINLQVTYRHVQNVRRCRNRRKNRPCKKDPDKRKKNPAKERNHHRRVNTASHRTVTVFPDGIGNHHVHPDRNTHEQIDEQVDDERIRTDCG